MRRLIQNIEELLNHEQRRQFRRRFLRAGEARPELQRFLAQFGVGDVLSEMLELYPMRPQDMDVLVRYILGQASASEAEAAFLESLRDPRWMMRWFERHHAKLTPISELVRAPARTFVQDMGAVVDRGRKLAQLSTEARGDGPSAPWWEDLQEETVLRLANRHMLERHPGKAPCADIARVERCCPGFVTAIRLLHLVVRDALTQQPRQLSESDGVDAMHAMYAPYVDIFRADRYMAPHLQGLVRTWGTTVVPRIEELPANIQNRLAKTQ
jgi:hypothetical protein